ncbi:hypothetical protein ACFL56_00980 [Candidatus Margulisiibacteriota bacterium]
MKKALFVTFIVFLIIGTTSQAIAENKTETKIVSIHPKIGEVYEEHPLNEGCSWYCGGGHYKVTASSSLKQEGKTTYFAKNAHDFIFSTAWIEGNKDYGIGEYIDFYFGNDTPRVTHVSLYNGYQKSDTSWKENTRVKKIKMYINKIPYAILHCKDTKKEQTFDLGKPLGHREDGKDLILRFEIMEVYPGNKYKDTAISELNFDGIDVH